MYINPKRLILILAILAVPAYAQFTPPANLGYCYYAAGGEWIPIASSGSSIGFTPPAISLYGLNGTTPAALQCDASGHIIPGGTAGGDLSGTYPNPTVAGLLGVALPTLAAGCLSSAGTTGPYSWSACASSTPSFSVLSSGTNTTAAMVVGTGASLAASGSGSIAATSVANALTLNNSNSGAASGSTYNGSAAVTLSANTIGAGSLANANTWSAANTFSVGITAGSASSSVSLGSNGAILQNMGATAAEQVQWGDRVGIGIPVPYVLATGTASPIAFDIAPTPGAANFTANTGVAWIDICDAAFANACSVTGNSNYESLRMGIMSNGTVHIESGQGGTGAAHPLCLQCTNSGGNAGVTIGGPLSTITSSAPLAVFASANPYINLGINGGSNQAYWAVATTAGFLFSNTVAGDMGIRNNNGNIYLGANSGTSNPANMEILSTGLQTDFFGPAVSTNANNTVYSTTAAPNGSSAGVYFMGENTSPTTGANACIYLSSLNTTYNSFFYLCNVSTSTNYVGNITILARSGSATYAEQAKMLESATVDGATWVTGNYTATVAAATVSSGQISYGGTTAAVSNCGSLATATACVVINVAGTAHYIPYY